MFLGTILKILVNFIVLISWQVSSYYGSNKKESLAKYLTNIWQITEYSADYQIFTEYFAKYSSGNWKLALQHDNTQAGKAPAKEVCHLNNFF